MLLIPPEEPNQYSMPKEIILVSQLTLPGSLTCRSKLPGSQAGIITREPTDRRRQAQPKSKIMKKYHSTLILALLIHLAYAQESNKDYTEAFQLVEVWLEAQKDFDQLPGLTAIVVSDQEVLWSGGVG